MLLQQIDNSGYPLEYLTARIGVRKGSLTSDWQVLLTAREPLAEVSAGSFLAAVTEQSAGGVWKAMLDEYRWVYRQMDDTVRGHFTPFFIWLELKTILLCLRNMQARRSREIETILSSSLLSFHVKSILTDSGELSEAVARLEITLALLSAVFRGAARIYGEQGIAGLERWLNDGWLHWAGKSLHPRFRELFGLLVDFRNLMRLYKALRWELQEPPEFLQGGRIARTSLREALLHGDRAAVVGLLRRFPGMMEEVDSAASPEKTLLEGIGKRLRQCGRELSGYGRIIEYLWLLYLETRNMGILLAADGPDEAEGDGRELLR